MIGTLLAIIGAIIIAISITLVRYNQIDGKSHSYALLQIAGSILLIISTHWDFHIGVILINGYVSLMCLHSIIRNLRQRSRN